MILFVQSTTRKITSRLVTTGAGSSGNSLGMGAAAIFAIVGFVCVIFTYIGVNTLLPGIHSYA